VWKRKPEPRVWSRLVASRIVFLVLASEIAGVFGVTWMKTWVKI